MDLTERLRNNQTKFDLTILIITLHSRLEQFGRLYKKIRAQQGTKSLQVLWLGDNKSMWTGPKRNAILSLAQGYYITFIDDDDDISDDYLDEIFKAMEGQPDVITFLVRKFENGKFHRTFRFMKGKGRPHRVGKEQHMNPGHLCVWKRDIIREAFPPKQLGEDHDWAEMMVKHIGKVNHIEKELYIYDFWKDKTETR